MRVVLATSNPGKIRELQALLAPLGFEVLPQSLFTAVSVPETGLSFVENAIIKARHAAGVSGLPAIADDSGLEVDALQGAPGILSARYAGEQASDQDNLCKLVAALKDVPPARRGARYRCALAWMRWDRDPAPLICQAQWDGRIIDTPRGTGGFGYDPVFELPEGFTAAELPAQDKNRVSHRGRALQMLVRALAAVPAPALALAPAMGEGGPSEEGPSAKGLSEKSPGDKITGTAGTSETATNKSATDDSALDPDARAEAATDASGAAADGTGEAGGER